MQNNEWKLQKSLVGELRADSEGFREGITLPCQKWRVSVVPQGGGWQGVRGSGGGGGGIWPPSPVHHSKETADWGLFCVAQRRQAGQRVSHVCLHCGSDVETNCTIAVIFLANAFGGVGTLSAE
eukprot:GGOE01033079.1.p2 GENE.GGOE01033079.1~~GGOE01033079.1.p2  ORF type:complete len:124 (-),score=4.17 GGOE01033079.1:502-873(-)